MRRWFAHAFRLAQIAAVRRLPLPWRVKRWIIWLLAPRFALGVHAVVADEAGRVLALRSAYSRLWQLPGGGMRFRESLTEAMLREGREELGLPLERLRLVAMMDDTSGRGLHGVFRAELPERRIRLSAEHTAWEYRRIEEMPLFYRRCAQQALAAPEGYRVTIGSVR